MPEDPKNPDFSNVIGSSSDNSSAGGSSRSGGADFSDVVSGSSSTAPSAPGAKPDQAERMYVVAGGDSLSKIAKKFNVTPEDLLAANPQIKNPNRIKVGDQLTIPAPAEPSPETAPSDEASPSP